MRLLENPNRFYLNHMNCNHTQKYQPIAFIDANGELFKPDEYLVTAFIPNKYGTETCSVCGFVDETNREFFQYYKGRYEQARTT